MYCSNPGLKRTGGIMVCSSRSKCFFFIGIATIHIQDGHITVLLSWTRLYGVLSSVLTAKWLGQYISIRKRLPVPAVKQPLNCGSEESCINPVMHGMLVPRLLRSTGNTCSSNYSVVLTRAFSETKLVFHTGHHLFKTTCPWLVPLFSSTNSDDLHQPKQIYEGNPLPCR